MENLVRLLCLKNKITVEELALKCGISNSYAQGIWDEKEIIDVDTLRRLCEIFHCSQDYLLCKGVWE